MKSQFSPRVSEVLAFSREEATRLASNVVGPEHLLLGILRGSGGPVNELFERQNTDIAAMRAQLEELAKAHAQHAPVANNEVALNEMANTVPKCDCGLCGLPLPTGRILSHANIVKKTQFTSR